MSEAVDPADVGLLAPIRAGSAAERLTGDEAYLRAMLDAEAALARAQARSREVPTEAADAIARACRGGQFDARSIAHRARANGNPVIPLVDDLRAATAGDAASWVHHGATSQDILDTATMLVAARTLDVAVPDLRGAADDAALLAARYRDTVVAARTLGQQAVPTTFGATVAGWLTGLLDAIERLRAARAALPVQLGGAAGTLAALGPVPLVVLRFFAEECHLALPALPWHTVRTPITDLAAALAHSVGVCGKVGVDVAVLAQTEIGEVSEAAPGGSSVMPHKRNPVAATLLVAAARQAPSLAAVLHASLVAEQQRPAGAWHAEWQPLRELLRLAGATAAVAADLLAGLQVHPETMAANLERTGGVLLAERVVSALAAQLGREAAQQQVREASAAATEQHRPLADLLAEQPDVARILDPATLVELTDPAGYAGAAPALVDRVLYRHDEEAHR